ncbi:MAG: PilT/PilU family type 4a pilus ATPase [bacterium]|nr:PilT/PilU family type 4a pilus ATPase [bacterium]
MQEGHALLEIIRRAQRAGATDLILVGGSKPTIYRDSRMEPLDQERIPAGALDEMILSALDQRQRERLGELRDLDFSFGLADVGRLRINVHYQRRSVAAAIRFVPDSIPDLDDLHLPAIAGTLAETPRGLVLVTGGTGDGKSTTLASMIQRINRTKARHVITLEDPIEYAFRNDRSIIEQRQIGEDAPSFSSALRHVVRQKPDVILVGEMRYLETIATALSAAETGHLVMASLHTVSAPQTIERIVDVFDAHQQGQIRMQLANTLQAIICQCLFRDERDGGMVPACEVLVSTTAINQAIREGNVHLIHGMLETGGKWDMQTMDSSIAALVADGRVSTEAALSKAANRGRLEKLLQRRVPPAAPAAVVVGANSGAPRKPWE